MKKELRPKGRDSIISINTSQELSMLITIFNSKNLDEQFDNIERWLNNDY